MRMPHGFDVENWDSIAHVIVFIYARSLRLQTYCALSGHLELRECQKITVSYPHRTLLTCSSVSHTRVRCFAPCFPISRTTSSMTLLFVCWSSSNPRHSHFSTTLVRSKAAFSPIPPAKTNASTLPLSLT